MLCLPIVLVLSACNGSGDSTPKSAPLTPELQAVLEQVAEVRKLPAPTGLRTATIPRSDVAPALDRSLTDDDRQSFKHLTTLYRLLGHLGPDEDYHGAYLAFIGDQLVGFYSPKDKQFFIVTDGAELDFNTLTKQEQSTVAHEFTHAIQDNSFDIQALFKRMKDDLDWSLALTSVLEGDAVNTEGSWARDHAYLPAQQRAILASLSQAQSVGASLEREFRFPYTTGAEWVNIVRSQRGNEAIDAILKGRRLTTAEVIHTDLYDSNFSPEAVSLPDLSKPLGNGWKHESGGAFGEFQLRNYLQLELTALPAAQAAAGWRGDRYDVYTNGSGSVAAFQVRFASSDEAQQFVSAQGAFFEGANANVAQEGGRWLAVFPDGRTTIRAATSGPDVIFIIGSDRSLAEAAFNALSTG